MKKILQSVLLSSLCFQGTALLADDAKLSLELNTAEEVETACRLSFLIQNEMATDITSLVVETVIFTSDAQVDRLTLFDFQSVPAGRPRVRQFDLTGTPCNRVGSLLINGVESCDGPTLAVEACQSALRLSSRIDIRIDG
ncbi:MAG: hypothetical protein AAFY06_02085 [Pseudomonadota bacterium]